MKVLPKEVTDEEIRAKFGSHLTDTECEDKRLQFYTLAKVLLDICRRMEPCQKP